MTRVWDRKLLAVTVCLGHPRSLMLDNIKNNLILLF